MLCQDAHQSVFPAVSLSLKEEWGTLAGRKLTQSGGQDFRLHQNTCTANQILSKYKYCLKHHCSEGAYQNEGQTEADQFRLCKCELCVHICFTEWWQHFFFFSIFMVLVIYRNSHGRIFWESHLPRIVLDSHVMYASVTPSKTTTQFKVSEHIIPNYFVCFCTSFYVIWKSNAFGTTMSPLQLIIFWH